MTDKELLELAAKAAGIEVVPYTWDKGAPWGEHHGFTEAYKGPDEWNPLHNDGQALRLAVKLGINIADAVVLYWDKSSNDPYAATRRAIARAAASIGKEKS